MENHGYRRLISTDIHGYPVAFKDDAWTSIDKPSIGNHGCSKGKGRGKREYGNFRTTLGSRGMKQMTYCFAGSQTMLVPFLDNFPVDAESTREHFGTIWNHLELICMVSDAIQHLSSLSLDISSPIIMLKPENIGTP